MAVSILIPAFRPTYLRQAIASALTQASDDLEILVSDDSGGDQLRPIVETFMDSRIRYVTTPGRIGGAENCRFLWERCRTERLMFLFDDDLLMPHAVAELTAALDEHPEASFAFGRRYVIDGLGRIIRDPPAGPSRALVGGDALADAVVGSLTNHLGELSNVLINRAVGLSPDDLLTYEGLDLHVVADVGFYLNASRKGPVAGVGRPVASFRKHGVQNSSPAFNPKFAIGIVEWELFLRGELDRGRITRESALKALDKLAVAYRSWSEKLPPIARMAPSLTRLRERLASGGKNFVDAEFRSDWDAFVRSVLGREGG